MDPTQFGGLPIEIVVWEILIRLSSKQLLRCRAWCCHLTSPAFTLAHHRIQPSVSLVIGYPRVHSGDREILALDCRAADPVAKLQPVAGVDAAAVFFVEASRDGLLILSDFDGHSRVCNPVTSESASLDVILGFQILGFYQHRPTGEYRLLLCPNKFS